MNNIDYHKAQVFNPYQALWESNRNSRRRPGSMTRVFAGSPYAYPIYGDLNKIRNLSNDRIRENYRKFQNLSNILLIIAGKFDINELKAGINKFFQNIPPGRKSQEVVANASNQHSVYAVKNWMIPGLKNNFAFIGIKAPGKTSYNFVYFDFLRYYLTDPRISRLGIYSE